jgi:hypothetical protein
MLETNTKISPFSGKNIQNFVEKLANLETQKTHIFSQF